jgi:hypothetical protein
MSIVQRNDACLILVDADVAGPDLRVLESNHYYFEELLQFCRRAVRAVGHVPRRLRRPGRDRLAPRPRPGHGSVEVPLTAGHVDQLRKRRADVVQTNFDRLPDAGQPITAQTLAQIDAGHQAILHLDTIILGHELIAPAT